MPLLALSGHSKIRTRYRLPLSELSTRVDFALHGGNDLSKKFERARGEGLHILTPPRVAGAQRDCPLGRTGDCNACVSRRITVPIARRSSCAGFADPPNRAMP